MKGVIFSILQFTVVVATSLFVDVTRDVKGDTFSGLKCNKNGTEFGNGCRCNNNRTFYVYKQTEKQCYHILTKNTTQIDDSIHFYTYQMVCKRCINVPLKCKIKRFKEIKMWNYTAKENKWFWQHRKLSLFEPYYKIGKDRTNMILKNGSFWEGHLISISYVCTLGNKKVALIKFNGNRRYYLTHTSTEKPTSKPNPEEINTVLFIIIPIVVVVILIGLIIIIVICKRKRKKHQINKTNTTKKYESIIKPFEAESYEVPNIEDLDRSGEKKKKMTGNTNKLQSSDQCYENPNETQDYANIREVSKVISSPNIPSKTRKIQSSDIYYENPKGNESDEYEDPYKYKGSFAGNNEHLQSQSPKENYSGQPYEVPEPLQSESPKENYSGEPYEVPFTLDPITGEPVLKEKNNADESGYYNVSKLNNEEPTYANCTS